MENWYARPVFFVSNCEEAIKIYETLGFHEQWSHSEDGKIMAIQMNLNGIELILNENKPKAGGGRLFVSLEKGAVQKYLSKILTDKVEIKDVFWGMPTKSIRDKDGNELLFYDDEMT